MTKNILISTSLLIATSLLSCGNSETKEVSTATSTAFTTTAPKSVSVPVFNEEQAYKYIADQVAFGPRIPNSKAQIDCANFLEKTLKASVDTVYRQETQIKVQDGKTLKCINLIGVINPKAEKRILLLAHWDSRPWADQDSKNKKQPVLGANDGASGVGVLLALAESIKANPLTNDLGVDILFTDVEDYGKSEWGEDSYALGTQYWAKNPHIPGYNAFGGILLDMVGGKNARFPVEGYSFEYAKSLVQAVWAAGKDAGYSSHFILQGGPYITDDHLPVNKIAKIPTIDIIDLPENSSTGFVEHWHTGHDDMSNIDKTSLKAVGQTLLQFLYNL